MEGIIKIEDYKIHCIIGSKPHEKESEQEIAIDIELRVDFTEAVLSDLVSDTIDYEKVGKLCKEIADKRRFHLLETFGYEILNAILSEFPTNWVKVRIKKKNALPLAKWCVVELEKEK